MFLLYIAMVLYSNVAFVQQMAAKVRKLAKNAQRKSNRFGKQGEADRHIHEVKPKHLFAGKRKSGKTDRR